MTDAAHTADTPERVRPALYMDFDGVLNFEASRSCYERFDDRLGYVKRNTVFIPEGHFRLRWSGELVRKLTRLNADWIWLTTWREYARTELDPLLDVHSMYSLDWSGGGYADPTHVGKFAALLRDVHANPRPFVWVDDVATVHFDATRLTVDVPFLLVAPDPQYGISKTQLAEITAFVERHS